MNQQSRLKGIDVARALAVFGMIIVNFKVVLGSHGDSWLKPIASIFDGKAAATFVVLAGVGLALMTHSSYTHNDKEKIKRNTQRIVKRAIFLFIIGLSYVFIWPADILHYYGLYMLITLLFLGKSSKVILLGSIAFILLFPLLLMILDYESGWNFATLDYLDFWTLSGFIRNLLFNGFHPVIPWTSFMLFGVWLGRQNLRDTRWLIKACVVSLVVFFVCQLSSMVSKTSGAQEIVLLLSTEPMPPLPIYMINGISIATFIISICILLAFKFNNKVIEVLNKTGQLALTFYVAHVVIGMGLVMLIGNKSITEYSLEFSVTYALLFSIACVAFAILWLKNKKLGPLEWIMRKLTD